MKYNFSAVKRGNDSRYFETTDGKFLAPLNLEHFNYLAKVNIEDCTYIPMGDSEYDSSEYKTINDLISEGKVVEKKYCREYTIQLDIFGTAHDWISESWEDCCNAFDDVIDDVIQEFKDNGFNVSKKALCHNYACWIGDLKSGYRGRGYHIFTPCGCNPLSFTATSLDKHFDWQETYEV